VWLDTVLSVAEPSTGGLNKRAAVTTVSLILSVALWEGMILDRAFACACCADVGERRVVVEKFDSLRRDKIEQLRFGNAAELFFGEADIESIKGIAAPSASYDLQVSQQKDGVLFAFRDKDGHFGTLFLRWPTSISIFEVDPRDGQQQQGGGPRLYKEWKLSSKMSGTGIFQPGIANSQFITLIVQGHGNFCTDFTHWTLVVNGPRADYSFFGDLLPPR
jgi:hypothetical protein